MKIYQDNPYEISLYPSIIDWLKEYLINKNPNSEVNTYDVHKVNLCDFIERNDLKIFFPLYSSYIIKIDLLGIIIKNKSASMVIAEIKTNSLSIANVSQILGYSKIADPISAFLISTKGLSAELRKLFINFNRIDVLKFSNEKYIRIAKWDINKKSIDNDSIIPSIGIKRI